MELVCGGKYKLIKDYAGYEAGITIKFKHRDSQGAYAFKSECAKSYTLWFSDDDLHECVRPVNPTDAQQFLLRAAELQQERGKQYDGADNKERSMGKTVVAFNAITGQNISESEGWLLLQLLKDVRQWAKKDYHADSAEDCIAYAALKAEALANGK